LEHLFVLGGHVCAFCCETLVVDLLKRLCSFLRWCFLGCGLLGRSVGEQAVVGVVDVNVGVRVLVVTDGCRRFLCGSLLGCGRFESGLLLGGCLWFSSSGSLLYWSLLL
jgi:hypothetical protein